MEDAPQTSSASTIDLPDDLSLCQTIIQQQQESLLQSQRRIEKLEHQLAGHRRHRFGAKSESLDQLQLRLEEEETAVARPEPRAGDSMYWTFRMLDE